MLLIVLLLWCVTMTLLSLAHAWIALGVVIGIPVGCALILLWLAVDISRNPESWRRGL